MDAERVVAWGGMTVTVRAPATALQGMRRTRLIAEALAAPEPDPDRALLRRFSYPDCVAGAASVSGVTPWPLDFESFIALPDEFIAQWEQAVYELHPKWAPGYQTDPKASAPANSTAG